jgi:hypothetical protein
MNLKQHLLDADPVSRDPELDAFHAQTMRQRIVLEAAAQPAASPARWWLRPIAVAGALAACLVAGVGIGLRIDSADVVSSNVERPFQGRGRVEAPRQMQFAAPGGTRIIWTFHQEFEL